MFGLISKAHHEAVVHEKDRQIEILADQIDWLRAHMGTPRVGAPANPTEQPPIVAQEIPYLSEEEEDLQHLAHTGQINSFELEEALSQLGFLNSTIETL